MGDAYDYQERVRTWETVNSAVLRIRRAFDDRDSRNLEAALDALTTLVKETIKEREAARQRALDAEARDLKMLVATAVATLVAIGSLIAAVLALT